MIQVDQLAMKKFVLLSAIALCLASSALGQYQTAPAYGNGYKKQNKMAPTPQSYNTQQQQSAYGGDRMQAASPMDSGMAMDNYGSTTPTMNGNEEQGYMKQQGAAAMKPQMGASGYGNKQTANNKYEEPQHPPMPFAWGYDINDGYGATQYHKENGDEYGKRTGSYGYMDAYGVYRNVYYVADENGFRATIKTNEPGTANESPADVELTAEEPPAQVFMGNKDNSGYGSSSSSSTSSYDSQGQSGSAATSGQYGSSASTMNGGAGGKQYGGEMQMSKAQYGAGAMNDQQQQYGATGPMMMNSRPNDQSASRYANKNSGRAQQQYGSTGMQGESAGRRYAPAASGMMASAAPTMMAAGAASQYGSQSNAMMMGQRAPAASGQYNNGAMMNAGKVRRYGGSTPAQGAQPPKGNKQYQGGAMAMMMDAADEMTTQQYGASDAAGSQMMQQEYGQLNMAAASGNGYGSANSMASTDDSTATAQHYGPASMLNGNAQMQQYGSNPMGAQMDGATSTYSSTRMSGAAGYSGAARAGAANKQAQNGDYETQSAGQNGGYGSKSSMASNQDYKKTAKNIASLVKRY